jgi:SAM-dependent methyltransferase
MRPPDLSRLQALASLVGARGQEMRQHADRFKMIKERKTNGTAPRVVVAHQLFQTPEPLAARLVSLLGDVRGLSVLEPSAGLGRLADALFDAGARDIQAVEINADCVAVLNERPWLHVMHADFLAVTVGSLGYFDAVAMNPPFVRAIDIKHVQHALQFLKPGGRLAGICAGGPRQEREIQPLCDSWERLPPGAFTESGTEVATFLFSITK